MDDVPSEADAIGVIELELLKLVRHLETFGRRSTSFVHVDRAGSLALRTLEASGPISTKSLAGALNLDASTVTHQLAALESAGFVERRPDSHDRRSSKIVLTSKGRRTMEDVQRERRLSMESLVSDWADGEKVTLARALNRLNASLHTSA